MATKSKRGTRYTAAQRTRILTAARKGGLTGAQVAKQFGVSALTFYRWRGPVRSDALARRGEKRGPGRPKGSKNRRPNEAVLRRKIRAEIQRLLPRMIREEVAKALKL